MRLTALVKRPEHVSCRYRLAAYRGLFEEAGHHLEVRPWPAAWLSRIMMRRHLGPVDAVVIQRRLLPTWQLRLIRGAVDLLLYDFDDAVFLRNSYAARGPNSATRAQRFAAVMQNANAVVAGNLFLHDQALTHIDSERVHIIPTCIETERYSLAEHSRMGGDVHLVWVGSSSTLRGLENVQPLLEKIGLRWPTIRLKLLSDRFLKLRHLSVIECPWSEACETAALAAADIGISWLPNDLWSRGKCGLKVLQYMAAGLPVVANPVGVQGEMVRHGETGFLANTDEEWLEAIDRLARDPALRQRMGRAGRRRVEAEFSVESGFASWLNLLGRLAQHGEVAKAEGGWN